MNDSLPDTIPDPGKRAAKKPAKAKPPLDASDAAPVILKIARSRKATKRELDSLDPDWKAVANYSASDGPDGIIHFLADFRERDPEKAAAIEQAIEQAKALEPADRPQILITPNEHEVIDQAVAAIASDPGVYQRGNVLTTVLRAQPKRKDLQPITRPPGSPRISDLPIPRLREMMAKRAVWYKARRKRDESKEYVQAHPPEWAVSGVAARGEWENIRILEAVVECPTLRPDGTVLDRPGYDEATGLLFEPNGNFDPIPEHPTHEDAKRSAQQLLHLVTDFPFKDPSHKAAWLAAALTPFARFAIDDACPIFCFDANCPSSGKTKLADIISILGTGRGMPRTAFPDSDDEMRKRITAIARAGDRLTLIDNIAKPFGGDAIDAALTGPTWKDRILGKSEMSAELPLFTVWYATGNNLTFKGDILRRVVYCRLVARDERPEDRHEWTIQGNLLDYVKANRPMLVAAALTILRAHALAGRPQGDLKGNDSYPAWSRIVRGAIHWVTGLDAYASCSQLRDSDPEALARQSLVEGWEQLPGGRSGIGLTAAMAISYVRMDPERFSALHDVLMQWSRNEELPGPKVVGVRLKQMLDRVVSGKFLHQEIVRGTAHWSVRTLDGE